MTTISVSPDRRVTVADDLLVRVLKGEAVLLSLSAETYFGLDAVGTHMWQTMTTTATLDEALAQLHRDYPDVDPARLRTDFYTLLQELVEQGLVAVQATL
jgi:hypothetical protein